MIAKGEQIISVPVFTVFIWQPWEHCVDISRYTNTVTHLAPALLSPAFVTCHVTWQTSVTTPQSEVTGWRVWKWWIIDRGGVNSWFSHNKTDTGDGENILLPGKIFSQQRAVKCHDTMMTGWVTAQLSPDTGQVPRTLPLGTPPTF